MAIVLLVQLQPAPTALLGDVPPVKGPKMPETLLCTSPVLTLYLCSIGMPFHVKL